jgi:CBS domain containing-hemolysin-like protein
MLRNYQALPASGLHTAIEIVEPAQSREQTVSVDDPAMEVMTDFQRVHPITISHHATMECAQQVMSDHRVHLLLATNERGCLAGIITSTDIEGEKPVRLVHERGIRRSEVLVSDIMTPIGRIEVLDMDDVRCARVGHVVATLKAVGRQHAMIVDYRDGAMKVRGLFSASQLTRQLGIPVETPQIARSFAEVEEMLAH